MALAYKSQPQAAGAPFISAPDTPPWHLLSPQPPCFLLQMAGPAPTSAGSTPVPRMGHTVPTELACGLRVLPGPASPDCSGAPTAGFPGVSPAPLRLVLPRIFSPCFPRACGVPESVPALVVCLLSLGGPATVRLSQRTGLQAAWCPPVPKPMSPRRPVPQRAAPHPHRDAAHAYAPTPAEHRPGSRILDAPSPTHPASS